MSRIEKSLCETISTLHNSNKNELISHLENELKNQKQITQHALQLSEKLDGISDKIPDYSKWEIPEKLTIMSKQMEDINKNLGDLSKNNTTFCARLAEFTDNTSKIGKTLHENSEMLNTTTEACQKLSENVQKLSINVDKEQDLPKFTEKFNRGKQTRNSTQFDTFNRFEPLQNLKDDDDEDGGKLDEHAVKSKHILIVGNSHVKNIRTDNFIYECQTDKIEAHSCDEFAQEIENLDRDFDVILLHMFTNDIRKLSPENCIVKHVELISKLQSKCPFAKVVVSLPFFTLRDSSLNIKIETCQILMKYQYVNNQSVLICKSSSLYSQGEAMRKFFVPTDGIHLNTPGLKVFIFAIKTSLRKALGIERSFMKNQSNRSFQQGQKSKNNQRNVRHNDMKGQGQFNGQMNSNWNQNPPFPQFFMPPPPFNSYPPFQSFGNFYPPKS